MIERERESGRGGGGGAICVTTCMYTCGSLNDGKAELVREQEPKGWNVEEESIIYRSLYHMMRFQVSNLIMSKFTHQNSTTVLMKD